LSLAGVSAITEPNTQKEPQQTGKSKRKYQKQQRKPNTQMWHQKRFGNLVITGNNWYFGNIFGFLVLFVLQ
jgi:hypothetical protein